MASARGRQIIGKWVGWRGRGRGSESVLPKRNRYFVIKIETPFKNKQTSPNNKVLALLLPLPPPSVYVSVEETWLPKCI